MRKILFGVAVGLLVAAVLCMVVSPRVVARARVVVVPEPPASGDRVLQLHGAHASAEHLSRLLGSADFLSHVASRAAEAVAVALPNDDAGRRQAWRKRVSGRALGGGVLELSVAGGNAEQASILAQAAVDALVARGPDYVGGRVSILVADAPQVVRWPGLERLPIAVVFGSMLGAGVGFLLERFRRKHL